VRFRGNKYASGSCIGKHELWRVKSVDREASVESINQFSGDRRRRRTEESTVKFMCCKIVDRLTVILPGEYSNKPSVKFRTHKLFVALPDNTQQHVTESSSNSWQERYVEGDYIPHLSRNPKIHYRTHKPHHCIVFWASGIRLVAFLISSVPKARWLQYISPAILL
jgi:hypothetical protein